MLSVSGFNRYLHTRRDRWVARRHPRVESTRVDKRNIYILPTAACAGFILLLLTLLLLAINYENNLIYGLTFLLVSVLLVSMVHTHNNLRDIEIAGRGYSPVFAGEQSRYRLHFKAPDNACVALDLQYPGGALGRLSLAAGEERTVELSASAGPRGPHHPGVLRISSRYPMGLFRAWSYINLRQRAWIYPKPQPSGDLPSAAAQSDEGVIEALGNEDFGGLKEYQSGMPLGRAAWGTLARGLTLQVKEFSEPVGDSRWLRWSFWPELTSEERLSRLCYWVLRFEREQKPFGLELPSVTLSVGSGKAQLDAALLALAQEGFSVDE